MKRWAPAVLVLILLIAAMGTCWAEESLDEKPQDCEYQTAEPADEIDSLADIPRPANKADLQQFMYWYAVLSEEFLGEPTVDDVEFMYDADELGYAEPALRVRMTKQQEDGADSRFTWFWSVTVRPAPDWELRGGYMETKTFDSELDKRRIMVFLYALLDGNEVGADRYVDWCKEHMDEDYTQVAERKFVYLGGVNWGGYHPSIHITDLFPGLLSVIT